MAKETKLPETFAVEMDSDTNWDEFNEMMDEIGRKTNEYIEEEAICYVGEET
jgi:hypothetical protein